MCTEHTTAPELPDAVINACFNANSEAILVADMRVAGTPICFVSDAFVAITGYSSEEALGRNCSFLQGNDRDQPEIALLREALQTGKRAEVTLRNYRKDGTLFYNRLRLEPVSDGSGALAHYVGFVRDVSDLQGAHRTIDELAHLDPTTRLLNRQTFTDKVEDAARAATGAIVIVKVDAVRFHDINSGYGYETGDRLLREISDRLKTTAAFAVGRMGANEFALAYRATSDEESGEIAASVLSLLEQEYMIGGDSITVRFSSGYAFGARDGDGTRLIRRAGTALHKSKRSPMGSLHSFTGDDEVEARRLVQLTAQLKHALVNNEFRMHYQPKVDLVTSRVIGAEALVRWMHPTLGMQSPAAFIPHAEDVGMIGDIDTVTLALAARFCTLLNRGRRRAIPISINISGHEIVEPALLERIRNICRREGADPRLLILELTETVLVDAHSEVLNTMNALRNDGFGISIDDFGTGYSSLAYIDRFPITEIKLDRSFVKSIANNLVTRIITESVIRIGDTSGFNVVAEGVETNEELLVLRDLRCPSAQGYLFGRPEDGNSFIARVQAET